jgi:hypothetical protein
LVSRRRFVYDLPPTGPAHWQSYIAILVELLSNPLDQFVKRELRCAADLRYVDDMALFSGSKRELWEWKSAILERLQSLRLTIHEGAAQVQIRQYLGIAPVRVEPLGVALKNNLDR